jgi:type II secretory pathway component PulM
MKIKERWEQLSPRDQQTVKKGSLILGAILAIQIFWWPLYHRMSVIQESIIQEQSLIEWMAPRVAQLIELKNSRQSIKKDKSLSAIEKSLQQSGLKPYLTEFSQNAQHQVSVSFSEIPFESCMEWIEQAQSQGWVVQQFNANKSEKTGIVRVDLVLG